jgi:hypothetical protein
MSRQRWGTVARRGCWTSGAVVATLATSLLACNPADAQTALPAFPGAEGFGAVASGGRGGQVLYVTNLDADGPGSLQAALDTPGPRYVLFRVSGVIDAPVQLTYDDVTIAGQTSPGGITIRGFHTTEEPYCDQDPVCIQTARTAENWVLRHVRLRPGDGPGGLDDGLRLLHTRRAVVDHVSVANATDEAVQISYASDVTIQYSTFAETLGGHANFGGMLLNYSDPAAGWPLDRLSIHHNVWNRLLGRMPEISRESAAAANTVMQIELSNNLLWDPGYFIDVSRETFPYGPGVSAPVWYRLNWVGNRAHARPGFPYGVISFPAPFEPSQTTTYFADNTFNLYPGVADYQLSYCCNDYPPDPLPATPSHAVANRHPFPPITITPSSQLVRTLYRRAGALPRDRMDVRLMAPLDSGVVDPAPRDSNPYGDAYLLDYPPGSPPPPPIDSDLDGMPNSWELAQGLDPAVPDHNGDELSLPLFGVAGYTNLECYLALLADALEGIVHRDGFELGSRVRWSASAP